MPKKMDARDSLQTRVIRSVKICKWKKLIDRITVQGKSLFKDYPILTMAIKNIYYQIRSKRGAPGKENEADRQ
jgi:hypothetical protein